MTAGAGTGKTRMLAERYLFHVSKHGLSPLAVVAVTFTEKAAAELRSRIRLTLIENLAGEEVIAEIEAAQISTIHSLAARICRDFYDLAGIPADFAVLDETESPLWAAEKFDEALSLIDADGADELGFKWLVSVLRELLRDPISSEKALSLGAENWRTAIDKARETAFNDLINSDIWNAAADSLSRCSGDPDDKLEVIRGDVLNAMSSAEDADGVAGLEEILKAFRSNSGSAKKWDEHDLESLRACLIGLKALVRSTLEVVSITFGPEDEEAARRIPPLAAAFRQVRDHMAAEKLREKVLDFNDLEHYALKILETRSPSSITACVGRRFWSMSFRTQTRSRPRSSNASPAARHSRSWATKNSRSTGFAGPMSVCFHASARRSLTPAAATACRSAKLSGRTSSL